jgi:hypothetical protein
MSDSSSSELTRLGAWLATVLLGGGGLLGWAKHRLEQQRQFVELNLKEAQTEEVKANVHKITVDSLIQSANERRADLERVSKDREHWRERAETAEARIEQLLEEQKERHKMANEVHILRIKHELWKQGLTYEEVEARRIPPIYPEAE